MSKQVEGQRIGWLDSTRAPSHIHRTVDGGVTTVCGHPVLEMTQDTTYRGDGSPRWVVSSDIPRGIKGSSRYCPTCFANGGKTLPVLTVIAPTGSVPEAHPAEQFNKLIRENGGKLAWETSCHADGEKFRLECWIVPSRDPSKDGRTIIVQRWRDGNCTIFRPHSDSNDLRTGLADLAAYLH